MKKRAVILLTAAITAAAVLLSGCGESKEAKEARLKGIEQVRSGDYASAVESFELALDESDGVVGRFEKDILKYRGEAEFMLEDYEAAAYTYGVLAEVDGGKEEYLYYKAASEAMAGKPEIAEEDYAKAAGAAKDKEQAPDGAVMAVSSIADAYRTAGEYDRAVEFCSRALTDGIAGPEIYNQMGLSMMNAERYDEAISYFEQGISMGDAEQSRQMMYNMGAVYETRGDFKKALETFRKYVAQYGDTPELTKEIAFLESR